MPAASTSPCRWDPLADAYVQFLGAHADHVRHRLRAADEERAAGRSANLTAVLARRAVAAKLPPLRRSVPPRWPWRSACLGRARRRRLPLGPAPLAAAWAGIVLGSLPLYALWLGVAQTGRNVAIAGAAGVLLAFFSVGGLAHGLMTGELGAPATPLSWVPLAAPRAWGRLGWRLIDACTRGGPFTRLRSRLVSPCS
ncbi:MAG: hypothetical protein ACLUQW_03885 [Collinsella sp.]